MKPLEERDVSAIPQGGSGGEGPRRQTQADDRQKSRQEYEGHGGHLTTLDPTDMGVRYRSRLGHLALTQPPTDACFSELLAKLYDKLPATSATGIGPTLFAGHA